MLNIQLETPVNYSVKEMIKLFDNKSNDFNKTISTVNSDSLFHEKDFKKPEKQKSNQKNISNKAQKAPDSTESTVFIIDQEYYEIFNPVYPSITDTFRQKIKKNKNSSQYYRNIKANTNFNQNKYKYIINNYSNYLLQVGDEFSEIHCLPLF